MKKLFLGLALMIGLCTTSYAADKNVDFIYVHGADQGPIEEFQVCVDKAHPQFIKHFEGSKFVSEHLLKGASINENPKILYWADRTWDTKKGIENALEISSHYTTGINQAAKTLLAHLLHDAVWVQKYHNMRPILNDLHREVMANYAKGEPTIIVGYSAGTFITYQYMINKYKYISLSDLAKNRQKEFGFTKEDMALVNKYAPEKTCLGALMDTDMLVANANGEIIPSKNKGNRMQRLMQLKKQTELSCAPNDAVLGVINFASPLIVFYSDILKDTSQSHLAAGSMIKYLIENDKVFLTVNYAKDPFGIPFPNRTYTGIEQIMHTDIKNNNGFFYQKMLRGGKNLAVGHSLYWIKPVPFTKAVAEAYEEGYKSFYQLQK